MKRLQSARRARAEEEEEEEAPRRKKRPEPIDEDYAFLAECAEGLKFDKHHLDDALEDQGELYWRVAERHAILQSQRDQAKQQLAEEKARVSISLRHTMNRNGEKATDKAVEAHLEIHKDVVEAARVFLEFSGKASRFLALKEAYDKRSYAIKDASNLYIANYYGPTGDASGATAGRLKTHAAERTRDEYRRRAREER